MPLKPAHQENRSQSATYARTNSATLFCKPWQGDLIRGWRSRLQVEIDFAGHPLLVTSCQKSRDEAQARGGVGAV